MSRSSKGGKGGSDTTPPKLEDDELFKAIGGQLDSNFDYSQWQRKAGKPGTAKGAEGRKYAATPATTRTGLTTASGGASHFHGSRANSATRRKKLVKKETLVEKLDREKKEEHIKVLQLRIRHRRQTIEEYKRRKEKLLEENLKLKSEIENTESESHDKVKKLLRKYEKYRGGITTLNDNFMKEVSDAQDEKDKTEVKIAVDIAALQRDVEKLDKKLREKQLELHILVNYKDKEYPVKSLRIAELQKQIEELEIVHAEEQQEIQHIVETEMEKYKKEGAQQTSQRNELVMEKAMSRMHPSLRDMAAQNSVMAKEVEFHSQELEDLKESNKLLEREVQELMRSPKTDIRQQLFPEFYPMREKCTPDMEVVLDIPTQEWLPI